MRSLSLLVALALTAGACSNAQQTTATADDAPPADSHSAVAPAPDTLALGEPFRLQPSEAAVLAADDVLVRFVQVLEDNRCPADVDCFQAGAARVQFVLADYDGTERPFTVEIPGGITDVPERPDATPLAQAGAYTFQLLRLQPYPGLESEAEVPVTATLRMARLTR